FPMLKGATAPRRLNESRKQRAYIRASVAPEVQERHLLVQIMLGEDSSPRSRLSTAVFYAFLYLIASIPGWGNGIVAVLLAYHLCVRASRLADSPMLDEFRLTHPSDETFMQVVRSVTMSGFVWRGLLFLGTFNVWFLLYFLEFWDDPGI